jgi:hypothetical protein
VNQTSSSPYKNVSASSALRPARWEPPVVMAVCGARWDSGEGDGGSGGGPGLVPTPHRSV